MSVSQFSGHVYCGQTAGCIKMPLGIEVGLGPNDIELHGNPAPLPQNGHSPQFSARQTDGQNYDSQNRASIAASRGKNQIFTNK